MFAKPLRSTRFGPLSAFVALALCYALVVQGLAAHLTKIWTVESPLHALCLSSSDEPSQDPFSDHSSPDHARHAPCCLIFGNGDLPRFVPLVSILVFELTFFIYPLKNVSKTVNDDVAFAPVQPRAPPLMG